MIQYFAHRLVWSMGVIIGVTLLTFVITNLIPADPAVVAAGPNANREQVEQLRREMGLDRPLPVQYLAYVARLAHGDFGRSSRTQRPVVEDLVLYFPATVELAAVAMFMYVVIGVPAGIIAAVRSKSALDKGLQFVSVLGLATPAFSLALLLQFVFFFHLRWLPAVGRLDVGMTPPPHMTGLYTVDSLLSGNWATLVSALSHLVLPALTLTLTGLANVVRITRRSMLTVLWQDYVRTARAKGLSHRAVTYRHALRNALFPIVTIIGLQAGFLMSGTVLIEVIFSWPGMGTYVVDSIANVDFQPIISATLVIALSFLLVNFVVDMSYLMIDPRVKY